MRGERTGAFTLHSLLAFTPTVVLLILIAFLTINAGHAQADDDKPVREIFVPFDDLNVLLEGDAERVFLTRGEYDDLIERAKQTPVEHAPRKTLVTSASYDATIANERASISGSVSLDVLEDGLHAIPLNISSVGVRNAMLDGEPASLGRNPQGQPILFVEGVGKHQLQLELVTVLHTSAAQQSLNFTLPTPPATQLRVTVPGNVEVRSGAAVVSREVDQEANVTRFELLPNRGANALVMSLNNRLLLQRRVVMARSVIVDEITQAYERLHATVSLGVLHGAVDQFRFRVPAGFEITTVESPKLARWQVEADDNGDRILAVALREPTTGTVVLNLAGMNNVVDMDAWQMPRLEPLDVANHVAVVGVLVEDRLAFESVTPEGLIPLNNAVIRQAIPESVFVAEPGAPDVRTIAAYYAPEDAYSLAARFTKPPARVDASTAMIVTLGEKEQQARGTLALIPRMEKLFDVDVAVPPGWQVKRITAADGTDVNFERVEDDGQSHLHIKLPSGVAPGTETTITLEATSIPDGWLDDWTEEAVVFPAFHVLDASSNVGAIAVQTQDDLTARPDQLSGLTPLAERERASLGLSGSEGTLAYRISEAEYSASFIVQRTSARTTARSFSFLRIEPEGLAAHCELIYDIQRARARRLFFELPASTPETLSIRSLGNVQVKETSSEVVNGMRRWTALLSDATRGQVRLAVDFEQPLVEDEPKDFALPIARAVNVAFQSAVVAVEGNPEFDVELETNGRKIDVGELVDAEYQVGKRLLGAFGFIDEPTVTVDVFRRPGYGLPSAIVERAELVTLVSSNGRGQTAARYSLRTKAAFLQVSLPDPSELWSASVDGKPAMPQRDGEDLVISLPPTTSQAVRDLQIVFETPVNSIDFMSAVETSAPDLAVRSDSGDQREDVPIADVEWYLVLPEGYRMVGTGGTLFTDDLKPRVSPALVVAGALYELTGGINRVGVRNVAFSEAPPATEAQRRAAQDPIDRMTKAMAGIEAEAGSAPEFDADAEVPQSEPQAPAEDAPMEEAPADVAESARLPGLEAVDAEKAESTATTAEAEPAVEVAQEKKLWALQGVRSLKIDLNADGDRITFRSMGVEPQLQATLVSQSRLAFLAVALALVVVVIGVAITRQSVRRKARFVIAVMVLSLAVPLLIGLAAELELSFLFEPAFYAASLLVPYYLLAGLIRCIAAKISSWTGRRAAATVAASLLVALAIGQPADAQQAEAPPVINADELLLLLQPGKPVALPEDAVIIPYDPEDEDGIANAEKVLVPYTEYARLWKLAFPDKPIDAPKPPAPYAFAGASYSATLAGEDYLLVTGRMDLDVYAESQLEIPLQLGGVLERVTLDGQPAKLRMLFPEPGQPANAQAANAQAQQPAAQPAPADPLALLYVDEPGRKQLELAIRMPLERSGGWRIVQGRVPTAPATELLLTVPQAETEVRLAGVLDRSTYETTQDNENIATALNAAGAFSLQWRPKVAAGQVDQSLTAQSVGILDVQEDGLRLTWQLQLQTRRSQRETFTVIAPPDYLVEQVLGENVRGWDAQDDDAGQQIDITLLKATAGNELITIHLSRREVVGLDELTSFTAPKVIVPDSVLHQGHLVVRRSPLLDVRAERSSGLSLAEVAAETLKAVLATISEENPLPLRPLQTYRFATSTFSLDLTAEAYDAEGDVVEQMLLRIADRETAVESRFNVAIKNRPVHQLRLRLPDGFELDDVVVPGKLDWAITTLDDGRLLTVYLTDGVEGSVALDVRGRFPRAEGTDVAVPRFEMLDVNSQTGFVVVQVDPSMDVEPIALDQADPVLLDDIGGWLVAEQRKLVRRAIRYRSIDYQASFRVTPREAKVEALSVTNIKFTQQEIEETVFIKFVIRDAGIRDVTFLLPAYLADAKISVPLLRQKTITPVADDPNTIRVQIELQDEVIDELILLVQNTRSLTTDEFEPPLPEIETGATTDRYVVYESAGRDEVVVSASDGFDEVNRLLEDQWKRLAQIFPGNITQAYAARDDAENSRLALTTRQRAMVETATARIRLATTALSVDANGAYRGIQEYRVDNKTEQFLEVELPAGAKLWTATVADDPVKPTIVPNSTAIRRARIPLLKTQTGEPDYRVRLKYGGAIGRIHSFEVVQFPLIKTININVDRSHVKLQVPDTYDWKRIGFGGTMGQPVDPAELEADVAVYERRRAQQLAQVLTSDTADEFEKIRAANSLLLIDQSGSMRQDSLLGELDGLQSRNERLQKERANNARIQAETRRQVQAQQSVVQTEAALGNSAQLQNLYELQQNNPSRNVVTDLDNNFDVPDAGQQVAGEQLQGFNYKWFESNRLKTMGDKAGESKRVQDFAKKMPATAKPSSGKPDVQLKERFGELSKQVQRDTAQLLGDAQSSTATRSGELTDQLQRYQQQLRTRNAQELQNQTLNAPAMPQAAGRAVDSRALAGGTIQLNESFQTLDTPAGGEAPGAAGAPARGAMGGGGFGGGGGFAGVARADSGQVPQAAPPQPILSGLASLDVKLPERGREFFFTTPRGEIELTARPIAVSQVNRSVGLLAIVAGLLVIWIAMKLVGVVVTRVSRPIGATLLLLLGLISVCSGAFPVLGIIAIAGSVWMFIRIAIARRTRVQAAA